MGGELDVMIRRARRDDAWALARVYVETWRSTYAGMLPDRVLLGMNEATQAERWTRAIARGGELIRVADDARLGVIGLASGGPARGKLPFTSEVYTLYVLPDAHGYGIGRALVASMFEGFRGRGKNSALIWVLASNPSRFFYEGIGGERVAERKERLWGTKLPEIAYGWRDLQAALEDRLQARNTS